MSLEPLLISNIIARFRFDYGCHSDTNIPVVLVVFKSTPGGDTYNTRSERMQCSKYEQEESHLSVPLFILRFYSNAAVNVYNVIVLML